MSVKIANTRQRLLETKNYWNDCMLPGNVLTIDMKILGMSKS